MRIFSTLAVLVLALAAVGGAAVALPEGAAKKTIEGACAACHDLDVVAEKRWTREKWSDVVEAMINRGAALKNEEKPAVVDYLAAHFGPAAAQPAATSKPDRGRELVRDICSLCHELDRLKTQELTAEEWATEIKGMISEGAPVTDEEFALIVEYLAKNFGPREETK